MKKLLAISILCLFLFNAASLKAQSPKLTIDFTKPGANVSTQLYGLMPEDINHSYDGGLYAELIKNRIFKDNPNMPEAWSVINEGGGSNKRGQARGYKYDQRPQKNSFGYQQGRRDQ